MQIEQKSLLEAAPPRLSWGPVSVISLYKVWHGAVILTHRLGHGGETQCHGAGLGTASLLVPGRAPRPALVVSPCTGTSCCTHPKRPRSCLFWGCSIASPSPPRALLRVPGGASTGRAQTPGLQPPSRTPSPSAGGCDSPGISAYGRGKWEVERLYFNMPLWVGDLEKQLGEQECEVQPPPLQAWLPCEHRVTYKKRWKRCRGVPVPQPRCCGSGPFHGHPMPPEHHCLGLQRG